MGLVTGAMLRGQGSDGLGGPRVVDHDHLGVDGIGLRGDRGQCHRQIARAGARWDED